MKKNSIIFIKSKILIKFLNLFVKILNVRQNKPEEVFFLIKIVPPPLPLNLRHREICIIEKIRFYYSCMFNHLL